MKARLVAEFGDEVLALPGDEGFDLAAYLVPALGAPARRRRAGRRGAGMAAPGAAARRPAAPAAPPRSASVRPRPVRPVIAADGVDTTVVAAFARRLHLVHLAVRAAARAGLPVDDLRCLVRRIQAGKGRAKVLGPALLFCLSFTVMFVALGMTATGVGTASRTTAARCSSRGVVLIALGVLFIATLFVNRLNREWRPEVLLSPASTGGPIVAGLAFAVAWLPCTGPTLGAILTAASTEDNVGQGGVLLAFYALGLAVPFILCALAFSSVSGFFRFFRDHYTAITVVAGRGARRDGRAALHQRADPAQLRGARPDGRPRDQFLLRPVGGRGGAWTRRATSCFFFIHGTSVLRKLLRRGEATSGSRWLCLLSLTNL